MNKFSFSTSYSRVRDFTSRKFIEVNEQYGFPLVKLSRMLFTVIEVYDAYLGNTKG